jgi:hypothetical protein
MVNDRPSALQLRTLNVNPLMMTLRAGDVLLVKNR